METSIVSTPSTGPDIARRAALCVRLSIAQLIALCVLFAAWHLVIWPPHKANALIIVAIQTLPLLAFLPGMLKRWPKLYMWLCFVILLYFCQGVVNAFMLPHVLGILGLIESLLTVGLFIAAMYAGRYLAQLQRA